MTSAFGNTAVILTEEQRPDAPRVRDALVESLGMHRIDATQQARRCGPCDLLVEHIDPGPAQLLVDGLARRGIRALALSGDRVPTLGRPQTVRNVSCEAGTLSVVPAAGNTVDHIVWDTILLFSLGVIQQPKETEYESTGGMPTYRGARTSRGIRAKYTQPDPKTELWVVTRPGFEVRRFIEEGLNYDYLGSRLQPSATMNFRAFLGDLFHRAPDARVAETVLSFLRKDKPGIHRFKTNDDFIRYCRAQTIIALRDRGELG